MNHALSTHFLANHHLTTPWLDRIFAAGIGSIEIFLAKQHLDWHNQEQIRELTSWFRDAEMQLHSLHSPMFTDEIWGRSGPDAIINIAHRNKRDRIKAVDEIKRALEFAEHVPCRYLVQHLGAPVDDFDEAKYEAAFTSLEEITLFAKHRGVRVLLENIPNELSTPERLVRFLNQTHLPCQICFDTGHANLMGGVAEGFHILADRIASTHVHDNDGKKDAHLFPTLAEAGSIDWRATMALLRERQHQYPLLLELKESPDFPQPLDAIRKIFDNLESL